MSAMKLQLRRTLAAVGMTLAIGCGEKKPETAPATPNQVVVAEKNDTPTAAVAKDATVNRFKQPFEQATIIDEIPDGQQLPPDRTIAGKATGPLRVAVENLWSHIALTDATGNKRSFVATVETESGTFEITLHPEWAPNHARHFIALAKLGYYDGLLFDRTVSQEAETSDGKKSRLDLVKAGCPLGTGDEGIGHIGYFLKPEFPAELKHEEGSVGIWRDANPATAGCRFYITLGPAPALDGEFTLIGKVTKGLDVVKAILNRPTQNSQTYPERERPVKPVAIKQVTITPEPGVLE